MHARGVRSIIVTSGTLSPLKAFIEVLGVDMRITLENDHVASSDQVIGACVYGDDNGLAICGSFKNRYFPHLLFYPHVRAKMSILQYSGCWDRGLPHNTICSLWTYSYLLIFAAKVLGAKSFLLCSFTKRYNPVISEYLSYFIPYQYVSLIVQFRFS